MYNKDEPRAIPGIGQILTSDRGGRKRQIWLNTENTADAWGHAARKAITPVGEPGTGLWCLDHVRWLAISAVLTNLCVGGGAVLPWGLYLVLAALWAVSLWSVCWAAWQITPGPLALIRIAALLAGLILGGHLWHL